MICFLLFTERLKKKIKDQCSMWKYTEMKHNLQYKKLDWNPLAIYQGFMISV